MVSSKSLPLFLLLIIIFFVGIILGFFLKDYTRPEEQSFSKKKNSKPPLTRNLFDTQTASIRGKITKVESRNLRVENLNKKVSGEIKAAERISIIKLSKNSNPQSSPSGNLNEIDLNTEVLIELQLIEGVYQATKIQYVIPAPSLKPITAKEIPSIVPSPNP